MNLTSKWRILLEKSNPFFKLFLIILDQLDKISVFFFFLKTNVPETQFLLKILQHSNVLGTPMQLNNPSKLEILRTPVIYLKRTLSVEQTNEKSFEIFLVFCSFSGKKPVFVKKKLFIHIVDGKLFYRATQHLLQHSPKQFL